MIKITKQYIAGFFDGEGSIGIYNRKDRYNGACLRTQLTQNKTKESFLILSFLKVSMVEIYQSKKLCQMELNITGN